MLFSSTLTYSSSNMSSSLQLFHVNDADQTCDIDSQASPKNKFNNIKIKDSVSKNAFIFNFKPQMSQNEKYENETDESTF